MKFVPTHRCPVCGHEASSPLPRAEVFHWCRKRKGQFQSIPPIEENN